MAARINSKHDEKTRLKIQTSQLVNRLQSFANGEVELTRDQIKAIEVLLKKSLPDLSSMTIAGDEDGGAIKTVSEIRLVGVKAIVSG